MPSTYEDLLLVADELKSSGIENPISGMFNNQRDLDIINKIFPKKKIIEISNDEMGELNSNLFSISKNVVVTNKKFKRINSILSKLGYLIEEIEYSNIAKMGGLFRCSTLPLVRL